MKKLILSLALLMPIIGLAQDHCPSFKVTKQRSGMHYELKKYKPQRMPREGLVVFMGAYAGVTPGTIGGGVSGRVQMVEYGFSGGWDARSTDPNFMRKTDAGDHGLAYTNAFGATIGKFAIIGSKADPRGMIDAGLGYGHSAHSSGQSNKIPVFGYGLASFRVYRDVWLSGSVHVTDFQSTPVFKMGIATLVW